MMCAKCSKLTGAMFIVLGVVFLLGDLGLWTFWGIQWWTVLFLLGGLCFLGKGKCPDCCGSKGKK